MTLERAPAAGATIRPADVAEVREALTQTSGTVWFRGAGTKLDWGARGAPADVVVDTRRLAALVEHSAGDMIAVVQPGLALADLQAALAATGQRLALDPPGADRGATVGGIFAANDGGPLRHRFGTLRDLAIGVTAVLADGTVAHAGGRVVKNVAGFDLVRLLCGSLGTLAFVAELVVRLHPLPEATRTLTLPAGAGVATRLTLALAAAQTAPTAVDWLAGAPGDQGVLAVRLEGRPAGIAAQTDAVRGLVAITEGAGAARSLDALEDEAERALWGAVAEGHAGRDGETVARAATLPGDLEAAAAALARSAGRQGVESELASHAGTGLHTARLRGGDAAAHAEVVRRWRAAVTPRGGTVVLRRRLPGVDDLVDPWFDAPAGAPSSLALMRRVKASLDPAGRCAPGRFVGGL